MPNKIFLEVGGKSYKGWKTVELNKSIEEITGIFEVTIADFFPDDFKKWKIRLGDPCTLGINNHILVNGYIDNIEVEYDAKSHTVIFSGRDVTQDLADCVYVEEKNEWRDETALNILKQLCDPYAITIVVDKSVTTQVDSKVKKFKANEGDTVLESIARLCLSKAILPVSYGNGNLTLTRAATNRKMKDALKTGVNIKAGKTNFSNRDRFSNYVVKGQGNATDRENIDKFTIPIGQARDSVFNKDRFRSFEVLSETITSFAIAKDRAKWEANTRAAKSRIITYEVQGWLQSDGSPWEINSLIKIEDGFIGINEEMLIFSLNFTRNEEGTVTQINVMPKAAFELVEDPVKKVRFQNFDPVPVPPVLVDYANFNEQILE